jgi:opacity protein-like surface antigen
MKFYFQKSLIIGIALYSSGIFAANNSYDGFYLGANIGAASLIDKESTDNPATDLHYLSALGVVGGGILGYDFSPREKLKFGVEAFINATDLNIADDQNYSPASSYTVKMYYNFGFRLLPGYEFTPGTIWHLILGYSNAEFNINDNGNYGIIDSDFNKSGFQFGLGMTTALFKNLLLRTDVLYTDYSSQTSNGITTAIPATTQIYHNNLATLEGNLLLIYKFS